MLISVGTRARPLAGIVISFALYKSCPAAKALPLVGAVAASLSSRTWSCCSAAAAAAIEGAMFAIGRAIGVTVLARGVGVAAPESEPRGRVVVSEGWATKGAGSITFVRLGSGELGSEGGSWVGAGVWVVVSSDILWCVGAA